MDTHANRAPEEKLEKAGKALASRLKMQGVETEKITIKPSRNSDESLFSNPPSACALDVTEGQDFLASRKIAEPSAKGKT